ncbi:helix-turn-helix domain-containing protein, partial [Brucella pseudogrignonensis]|uniref:helix-turn-helix domain-containing protein n=1 Tax=Brucella pseudogrignonensis TaxID=419475 RepID=UPI00124CFA91
RLAEGESVTNIALDLGYENASAFIAMFRRMLGTTPARYINETLHEVSDDSDFVIRIVGKRRSADT